MSTLCRIGIHRWSFSTQVREEPGEGGETEIIRVRCDRDDCARYGTWSVVHRETRARFAPYDAGESPFRIA